MSWGCECRKVKSHRGEVWIARQLGEERASSAIGSASSKLGRKLLLLVLGRFRLDCRNIHPSCDEIVQRPRCWRLDGGIGEKR